MSVEKCSDRFYDELRRRVYTTPKSFLDLISLYLNTLKTKREEFNANKNRLASGVNKLNTTNVNIAELKEKLTEMQPILVQKNADLKVTLEQVSKDKAEADAKEAVVMEEKEVVEQENNSMIKDTQGRYKEVKKQSVNLTNSHVMLTVHLAGCTNHARTYLFFKLSNVPENS